MYERYTDCAKQVVKLAQDEARELKHPNIDTEHILLGLLREGEVVAAQALRSFGITAEAAHVEVVGIVGRGEVESGGPIPFTTAGVSVLSGAFEIANQIGHVHIGTEHILLSLIRGRDSTTVFVLLNLGTDLSRVADEVVKRVLSRSRDVSVSRPRVCRVWAS